VLGIQPQTDEAAALVPHLLRLTPVHRTAARELQKEVAAFSREITDAFDEVWPVAPNEYGCGTAHCRQRMAEKEKDP
jgi:hypothetical protein